MKFGRLLKRFRRAQVLHKKTNTNFVHFTDEPMMYGMFFPAHSNKITAAIILYNDAYETKKALADKLEDILKFHHFATIKKTGRTIVMIEDKKGRFPKAEEEEKLCY